MINLYTPACEKLWNIYHKDKPYVECVRDVADLLTKLKIKARQFYVDTSEYDIALKLSRYCEKEIKEMMDFTKLE